MDLKLSNIDSFSESSSEDEEYGGNACSILSSLEETIGRIDDFLSFKRVFVQGDIVCFVKDPSLQTGRVVNVDMVVDLEGLFGSKICNVDSKKLQTVRSIAVGDYVVRGPWLGKVEKVVDRITVLFDDGFVSEFTTMGSDIFTPISPDLLEDPRYPFYPGQRVKIHTRFIPKSDKWFYGTRNDKSDIGTVCSLDAGVVCVGWIGCVSNGHEKASVPPHMQDSKNLTLLSCFSDAKWQVGDWCLLPVADYGNFQRSSLKNFPDVKQAILPPIDGFLKGNGQRHKLFQKMKELVVIVRTKTKVDVMWQDGNVTFGLDSNSLSLVNAVDSHDFWPGQFVLQKDVFDDSSSPSLHRWGVVTCLDAIERTVRVKWTKELNSFDREETVSAYELMDHPDYSYCLGDAVFRFRLDKSQTLRKNRNKLVHINDETDQNSNDYSSSIGIIVGFNDGNIKVKWANGATSMVAPYEVYCIDTYEDASTAVVPYSDNLDPPNGGMNLHGDKQLSREKGKDLLDFHGNGEICKVKLPLATGSSSFSQAVIALFSRFSSSMFGTSLFGGYHHIAKEENKTEILGDESEGDNSGKAMEKEAEDHQLNRDGGPSTSTSSKLPPESFSQFDIVNGCSDHHFVNNTGKDVTSSLVKRGWLKRVQEEWNILEHDLPEAIYVRVYEERMDLLRAAIVGAPGTPYHDGLFFFDICFPPEYPYEPPMVYYNSGGLRVNPNLYESGKVCLSLLNTWTGSGNEVWNPKRSTILQLLLSLQALVLNEKPYFNEAGYDSQVGKADGEKNSVNYNENAYLVTCKSILYLLRNPPKHFEALLKEHLSRRGDHILLACKAYMDDTLVGSCHLRTDQEQMKGSSKGFKIMIAKILPRLVEAFSDTGIRSNQFLDVCE